MRPLVVVAGLSRTTTTEQGVDFTLGLASIAFGLVGAFGATDEGGSDVFFEIAGALLVLAGIALIVVSAVGKSRGRLWRNT